MLDALCHRQIAVAFAVLLLASACGRPQSSGALVSPGTSSSAAPAGQPTSAPTPSTRPSARASQAPLPSPPKGLMVLTSQDNTTMTVRLMDANGRTVASTQFTPPPLPRYGPCESIIQPPVRVANGAAYFADSAGAVRKLDATGAITSVATFPLTNKQQALSYAVSPDGAQLIAIILNTPPLHSPPPQTLGDPLFDPGTYSLDLERASAGGTMTVVLHKDLGPQSPSPTEITGWDNGGPTATVGTALCTQNIIPTFRYTGTLIHLALDGTHVDQIGGASCQAWDELVNGTVLCGGRDGQSFIVRRSNGDLIWSGTTSYLQDVWLSPDGNAMSSGEGTIYARGSAQPASFARNGGLNATLIGWAGPDYAVAWRSDGRVGLVAALDPLAFRDLGVTIAGWCNCAPSRVSVIATIA